jgi:hypothetical protein
MSKDLKKLIKDNGATVNSFFNPGHEKNSRPKHSQKLKDGQKVQRHGRTTAKYNF